MYTHIVHKSQMHIYFVYICNYVHMHTHMWLVCAQHNLTQHKTLNYVFFMQLSITKETFSTHTSG